MCHNNVEAVKRRMEDPYYLCESKGVDKTDRTHLHYDLDIHKWVGMNPLVENDGKSNSVEWFCI